MISYFPKEIFMCVWGGGEDTGQVPGLGTQFPSLMYMGDVGGGVKERE